MCRRKIKNRTKKKITKTLPITTGTTIYCAMMLGVSPFEFEGKSVETETTSGIINGGRATVEQVLRSEERNKSKKT